MPLYTNMCPPPLPEIATGATAKQYKYFPSAWKSHKPLGNQSINTQPTIGPPNPRYSYEMVGLVGQNRLGTYGVKSFDLCKASVYSDSSVEIKKCFSFIHAYRVLTFHLIYKYHGRTQPILAAEPGRQGLWI